MSSPDIFSLLYVDDDHDLLLIGKTFLERMGDFSVEITDSAASALSLLKERKFDAVISDYQMPSMNGLDLLKAIRSGGDSIPFIIFTGRGREEVVIEALNAGADFYLQKGGDPRTQFVELAHKVRQAIGRKRAERMLVESQKRLADIIEFLPDATFAIDREGRVIAWNRAMEEMTGVPGTEVLGMGGFRHGMAFYGEPRPMLIDLVLSPMEDFERDKYLFTHRDGTTLTAETRATGRDGRIRHYWGKASRLFDENGDVAGAIESIRDITDRVTAEERSRVLAQIIDIAPASITVHDREGNFLYANQKTFELHGFSRDEFMAMKLHDLDTPASAALIGPRMQEIMERGEGSFSVFHRKKNGDSIPLQVVVKLINWLGKPAMISVATDLSALREAERKVRESEERFRRIVETANEGIWEMDEEFRTTYVNPRMASLLGYTPEEMLGQPITSFMPESELADNSEKIQDRMAGKPGEYERRFLHRDGSVRVMHLSAAPIFDSDGNFRGSFTMLSDITERKRIEEEFRREHQELMAAYEQITATEEELRRMLAELREYHESLEESEERYRRILSGTFDAMVIHREGKITWANRRALEVIGAASPQELVGHNVLDFVHPDSQADVRERISRMKEDPDAVMPLLEEKFVRPDGSPVHVEVAAMPIREKGDMSILVVFRDISERKRMQDALMSANRKLNILNSITRHDIQNKVSVLSGFLSLLSDGTRSDVQVKCIDSMRNALHAMEQIIQFTRNYQDLGVRSPEWQSLSGVMERVTGQFELDGIAVEYGECSCEVFADPMLEKVFFTLVDNALRYGGGITRIRVSCAKENGSLVVTFEDDGVGIPRDQKEKIFEQGYGKGTGLGLFLSREILSITGLSIRECGTPGQGARFEIRVPEGLWRESLGGR